MKIAVLGATGHLGSQVLSQALDAGHQVTAYVRDPSTLPPRTALTVVRGTLEDVSALTDALAGTDVVVVSIMPRIKISAARKPTDFMQKHLPLILTAVQAVGARLVLVSANGVGDSAAKGSALARFAYRRVTQGLFEDKRLAELPLKNSGIDWTVVLPVNLKDAKAHQSFAVKDLSQVTRVPGLPSLPYADAATAILQVVTDASASGKHLLITTPAGWK